MTKETHPRNKEINSIDLCRSVKSQIVGQNRSVTEYYNLKQETNLKYLFQENLVVFNVPENI